MTKETESKFVFPLVAASTAAIGLFIILYWSEFRVLLKDTVFTVLFLIGVGLFIYFAGIAVVKREDPNKDNNRWFALALAALICIWVGAWCSQYRSDKKAGIEYKYGQ